MSASFLLKICRSRDGQVQEREAGRMKRSRTLWLNSSITNVQCVEASNRSTASETESVARHADLEFS